MTDPLRDWWDSLSELDQFNAYRIEKSNADALASTREPGLREALEIIDSINGCHGCLDNGGERDKARVAALRAALASEDRPDNVLVP